MIKPFVVNKIDEAKFLLDYHLTDMTRVSNEFKIFTNVNSGVVDPKVFKKDSFVTKKSKECIIPPNSFALAELLNILKFLKMFL